MSGFTTMLLEFLILTAVSDILCAFVVVSRNSLSCSSHQFLFNMIVGMMPSCRGSCQRWFLCDMYSLHFASLSVFVNNSNGLFVFLCLF